MYALLRLVFLLRTVSFPKYVLVDVPLYSNIIISIPGMYTNIAYRSWAISADGFAGYGMSGDENGGLSGCRAGGLAGLQFVGRSGCTRGKGRGLRIGDLDVRQALCNAIIINAGCRRRTWVELYTFTDPLVEHCICAPNFVILCKY